MEARRSFDYFESERVKMTKSTDKSRESSRRRENGHGKASHDHANGEEHRPNEVSSSGISPSSGGRPKRRLRIRVRMPAVSPPSPNASVQASEKPQDSEETYFIPWRRG